MPRSALKELSINLIPSKGSTKSVSFLSQAISLTRFGLTSLEILLILAFFFQLKLLLDFNTSFHKIKDNLNEISSSQKLEEGVNDIASRLKFLKKLNSQPSPQGSILENLGQILPNDLTLISLKIEKDKLNLTLNMLEIDVLQKLESLVNTRKDLKNFTINQITIPSKNSPFYSVSASVEIVPQEVVK